MKKLFIIPALFMGLAFSSCDSYLDLEPQSVLTPDNAYQTPSDWEKALYGAYGSLQEVFVGKWTITLGEFGTDEVIPFDMGWAAYSQLHYYTFSAGHEFLDSHYRVCYEGIKRCNGVLDMPSDVVSAESYNSIIMQARFLRGVYYFSLVKMYGGVPLWLKSSIDKDNIMIPRATVDEVYEAIVADMEAALGLPATWSAPQDKGRVTSSAAQAMLARVYLQWGKPAEALKYCKMLDGKFRLYDNLKDIFDPKNKNQEIENIFEIQFKHSGAWGLEGSLQANYWGPRGVGGPTAFGGWGGFGPTRYLYDSYDVKDKRRSAFFFTEFGGVVQDPPSTSKFFDSEYGNEIEDDNVNYIMIRYADVLLMKAEALNAMGDTSNEKYDAINQIRRRAGLSDITSSMNLSKEAFADLVLEERLHELCCEHVRRDDLVRHGKLVEYMRDHAGVTIQPYHVLYPIPQAAMDANEAINENNPGY